MYRVFIALAIIIARIAAAAICKARNIALIFLIFFICMPSQNSLIKYFARV